MLTAGDPPFLASTLGIPPIAGAFDRPAIAALLDRAMVDSVRLCLVSAPPGYGKSTAVAAWALARSARTAWLTLDESDADPVRFARRVARAMAPVRPAAASVEPALASDHPLAYDVVAAVLLEAVALDDTPLSLVLDDYHLVR